MNKRIQELAEQCTIQYRDGHGEYVDQVDVEKFGELIVRECAEVAGETRWAVPPTQEQIARSIKQHFGVEE